MHIQMDIHTYIHNWPLQTFSQDYGLTSHTFHVVCVNIIREWRDLHFNVKFFEKLSIAFPKLIDSDKRSIHEYMRSQIMWEATNRFTREYLGWFNANHYQLLLWL